MFKNLFRPKWENPKSQLRQQAIAAFHEDNPEHVGILLKLAREDSEPAVRRDAVQKVSDLDVLSQISRKDLEAVVRDAANQRLLDLLGGKSALSPSLDVRLARVAQIRSPLMLTTLIRDAQEIDIKLAAVEQLNDDMYLEEIALHSSIAKLRQAAAEKISTPALLQNLVDNAKSGDKSVYRIAKEKLEALTALSRASAEQQSRLSSLCEQMEAHARGAIGPLYAAKTHSLLDAWKAATHGHDDAALAERFEAALDLANSRVHELLEREQKAIEEAQASDEATASLVALQESISELQQGDGTHYDIPALSALIATQELRWNEATSVVTVESAAAAQFRQSLQILKELLLHLESLHQQKSRIEVILAELDSDNSETTADLEKEARLLIDSLPFCAGFPKPPLLETLRRVPQKLAFRRIRQQGAIAVAPEQDLSASIAKLKSLVESGSTREASNLAHALHLQLKGEANTSLKNELSSVEQQLREMQDWRRYAVLPKKESLCEEMTRLAESPLEAPAQAARIQELRETWKSLGVADHRAEQPLWEKFQLAADTAYAHCKEWIDSVKAEKQLNLDKRKQLLAEAKNLLGQSSSTECDWKSLRKQMKGLRDNWKRAWPVDPKAARAIDREFHRSLEEIEGAIHREERRNAGLLEVLVRDARSALELDSKSGTAKIKQLQEQWKGVGITSAKDNHRQWPLFREACDAVFAKLNAEKDANKADLDNRRTQAAELANRVSAIDANDGKWKSSLQPLREALSALSLPSRDQAVRQFERAVAELENRVRESTISRAASACSGVIKLLELADTPSEGQPLDQSDVLLELLDRKWGQVLQQSLLNHNRSTAETRRIGIVKLESMLDISSPESDRELRRELQMQALVESGLHAKAVSVEDMIKQLLVPADGDPVQLDALRSRLKACITASGIPLHRH